MGLVTLRENYSLRGDVSCAFSSAHIPVGVANKKTWTALLKTKSSRDERWECGIIRGKSWKLMAWQATKWSALLVQDWALFSAPTICSTPVWSRSRQGSAFHILQTSRLVVQTSVSSVSPVVPFSGNKRKKQGSSQSTEQQFWTWGPQWGPRKPKDTVKLFASCCAYTFIVHFSGKCIHCFITNSSGFLTWKKLKNHCLRWSLNWKSM